MLPKTVVDKSSVVVDKTTKIMEVSPFTDSGIQYDNNSARLQGYQSVLYMHAVNVCTYVAWTWQYRTYHKGSVAKSIIVDIYNSYAITCHTNGIFNVSMS